MSKFSSLFLLRSARRLFRSTRKETGSPLLQFRPPNAQYRFMFSSYQNQDVLCKHPCAFFNSTNQQYYAPFSSLIRNGLEVEIVSKENIKPASPTPQHSRIHEVSSLDQLVPNIYVPFIYFYANDDHQNKSISMIDQEDLNSKRRHLLKQSLSEILTKLPPLAGRIKDNRLIDCNDDGVYYVETKVNTCLSDFLKQPDNKSMHGLLPADPNSVELFSKTDVVMIQVNAFSCGGIGIGVYASHKIFDGYSHVTFLKAWAATARASSSSSSSSLEKIYPNFISPSIFPSNPCILEDTSVAVNPVFLSQGKNATRRFVFNASSLALLKNKAGATSRVTAATALIWKRAMLASKATNTNNTSKKFVLTFAVNIRERCSPRFPPNSMGNIILPSAPTQCRDDEDLGLESIAQRLKRSIDVINSDLLEKIKGEEWSLRVKEFTDEQKKLYSDENTEYITITSMCNGGVYEADFGWGKPIWMSTGNADATLPSNVVLFTDTRSGDGVEAWVNLSEEDMQVLERDPELLAFASLNPSPLSDFVV